MAARSRTLTPVEIQALFDNSPPHLADCWQVFMLTGMRRDELAQALRIRLTIVFFRL